MITWLTRDSLTFPPLHHAAREPNGLLAVGGDLSPDRLIRAYRHGCFPWYQEGQPLLWWSPDPRTVLYPDKLHIARSLKKTIRSGMYDVTFDQDFEGVIQGCAGPRANADGTWITHAMQRSYRELHRRGIAHSVEAWREGELVGGLYGLAMGTLFFGESMFSRAADASKVAFVHLVRALQSAGFHLIDCQMHTEHLARFGSEPISRNEFAQALSIYLPQDEQDTFSLWPSTPLVQIEV